LAFSRYDQPARVLGACLTLGLVAPAVMGCGKSERHPEATGGGDAGTSATGDQAVFSEIDVVVELSVGDIVDYEAAAPTAEPPIRASAYVRVEINGARAETRVAGLQVLVDDVELTESGSAGLPQQFSYQGSVDDAMHGQELELEFRYQASSFPLAIAAPVVELTAPAAEATLSAEEAVTLAWVGAEAPPDPLILGPLGQACKVDLRRASDTTFAPMRDEVGQEPPCRFEISATWRVEATTPPSPFESLRLERGTRRVQRFTLQ
jgi:hypothetical protein